MLTNTPTGQTRKACQNLEGLIGRFLLFFVHKVRIVETRQRNEKTLHVKLA